MEKLTIKLSAALAVEISADKSQDLIRIASFWQAIPSVCGFKDCGHSVIFEYATPKTYKYYKIRCTGPQAHSLTLSERQDGSGMYVDKSKPWEIWRAGVTDADALEQTRNDAMADPRNAPDTERGQMIAEILRLADLRRGEGKQINLKLDDLGTRQSEGLAAMIGYLEKL